MSSSRHSLHIAVLALLLSTGSNVEANTVLTYAPVEVKENSSAILSCYSTSTPVNGIIYWIQNYGKMYRVNLLDNPCRALDYPLNRTDIYTILCDETNTSALTIINVDRLQHGDTWQCRIGFQFSNVVTMYVKGDGVFWGYDVLHTACSNANLKAPDRITCTALGKYMATLTQVLDLQPHQLEWVLNHLDHTLDVHKIYYRAASDVLERTQIAKILLLHNHDRIGEFKNKKVEDIQFTDLILSSSAEHEASHYEDPLGILTRSLQESEESHDDDNDQENIEGALFEAEHFDFVEVENMDEKQKKSKKRNAQQTKIK